MRVFFGATKTAPGREVSLSLQLWFIAKIQAVGTLLSQLFEDLAYDACQHCPNLWKQGRFISPTFDHTFFLVAA